MEIDVMAGLNNVPLDVHAQQHQLGIAPAMDPADRALFVEFSRQPVFMSFKSEQEGRPIYESRPFVRIVAPGGKTEIVREVRFKKNMAGEDVPDDSVVTRFPVHWARFLNGDKGPEAGTPVKNWTYLSIEQQAMLEHIGIRYVEQLEGASDATLQHIGMGARELQRRAKMFLEAAKGTAAQSKLLEENKQLREDVKFMKEQFLKLHPELASPDPIEPKREPKPSKEAAVSVDS